MPLFELVLTEFLFPEKLPNGNANFRFIVDLRFINDKGHFTTEHAVMPGLDTFWECDKDQTDMPNYVRNLDKDGKIVNRNYGGNQFNMCAIDDWDKLILCVNAQSLHSIQFKVFDVDRKDAWDKVQNFLEGMIGAVIGQVKGAIPESLGGAADDLQSFLLKKLAGGDKVLFRKSKKLEGKTCKKYKVAGQGEKGKYKIGFQLKEEEMRCSEDQANANT